ncbi:cyclic-phosphate processing receiver domain-containing protein [Paenibacillus hunanensis]|uniref:cyclic-phosphate processing receiver domain-containing protein n=1 Tax=Paenibacillus hunanensis TaxID=539262 RepID=UPI002A69D4D4|nr:cyclic-phosphate processing receiver domain-containing protein [Paenibacillus hunanensis]WPP43337.1 cyclic-phosphate processing receiver domain-containing protein [Paenibacillus hunanensis]
MIHLYLDDYRPCPAGFALARDGEECLMMLRECEVDILSLDHELGWGQMDGTDVVKAMIHEGLYAREIYLHTSSMSGKKSMYELLYQAKPEHVILHNGPIPAERLEQIARTAQK